MANKKLIEKFVSIEKMSKKQRRKQYAMRRQGWDAVSPVTRVIPNKKKPTRAQMKSMMKANQ